MEFLKIRHLIFATACVAALASCRTEDEIYYPEKDQTGEGQEIGLKGFYLLNEGNMGSNKASLDHYSFADAIYSRNIYAEANPTVPKELGDVGNDMQAYGSRLWTVVNCSNKIEVLNLHSARRLGQVDIPNCRYVAFDGPYAYATSYAGPVEINPEYRQRGYVARIDTLTLEVTGRVDVGFQPDGIAVSRGKIYVANSGGYMVPNYENTLSVIDAATMKLERSVEIGINLDRVMADSHGRLWISSRGDYFDTPARLYVYDPEEDKVVRTFDCGAGAMWLDGDSLYAIAAVYRYSGNSGERSYAIFDTKSMEKVCDNFITDGSDERIKTPYGVAVNPETKEIYVCDATSYVNPGYLYCYTPEGTLKWTRRTGDIPKCLVFY